MSHSILPEKKKIVQLHFFDFHNLCKVIRILKRLFRFFFEISCPLQWTSECHMKQNLDGNKLVPIKISKSQNQNKLNICLTVHQYFCFCFALLCFLICFFQKQLPICKHKYLKFHPYPICFTLAARSTTP